MLKCRQCHTILWLGAVSSLPYRPVSLSLKQMFRHVVPFFRNILHYSVDTTDTKPHCNVTDKQTNEQTHKMTQTLQVSLEPNLDLVLRPTNPIPALADILGRIPRAYKPAQRSWVVNIGRMEAEAGISVYDIIANDIKPTLEGQGYAVKFNQQVSVHARSR